MIRISMAILALCLLAACGSSGGGSGEDVLKNDTDPDTGTDPGTDPTPPVDETGVPDALKQNMVGFAFSADKSSVTISATLLDSTPEDVVYTRNDRLTDATPGYIAYTVQEDSLDRLFIAIGAESLDEDTRAMITGDGGQFNRVLQGGYYERDGSYSPPAIDTGPGAGQVSYAGSYAGITNVGTTNGSELIAPTGVVDDSLLPRQSATVTGTIFLNANFVDNNVNGGIYDRVLVSPIDPTDRTQDQPLDDLSLIITDIDENGEFFGEVEFDGVLNRKIGDYGGIFGGAGATSVAGVVALTEFDDNRVDEIEIGVFVLTQCGQPGDTAVCSNVAP